MNGQTTQYFWDDRGVMYKQANTGGNFLWFYADPDGTIGSINYNDARYSLLKNAQGDVIGLANSSGSIVALYCYDSWGNIISITDGSGNDVSNNPTHIANINPIRYRGYYYDTESGLYYLQSRYYDPEICRWVSADTVDILDVDQDSLFEDNLFVYCLNNPVNMEDQDGELAWFIGAAIGGALFDTAAYLIGSAISGEKITIGGIAKSAAIGAISGVAFGAIGKGVKAATTALKASKTAKKFASAGIKIMNKKYANKIFKLSGNLAKKYGGNIKFNKYGFPDFSRFSKYTTKIRGLTGNYAKDSAMANARFGLRSTPKGYTWHHVEDGLTMMLIPTDLHQAVRHTGGAALIKTLF